MFHRVYSFGTRLALVALATVLATSGSAARQSPASAGTAPSGGVDTSRFDAIAAAVERAIADKKLPGAVVLVGRGDRVLYEKAVGQRALEPAPEPMTADTIFDQASLTKVIATTTSVMKLMEDGRIRMNDKVAAFVPGFERYGKADITIRQLMTHTSGLRPDLDLADSWSGYDTAIGLAIEEVPTSAPGARFVYSDINYILLGEIVRRVSGQPLNEFARAHIFAPLGMTDTMFLPADLLKPRIAPTEKCTPFGWPCEGANLQMLRGVVHDPTARRMGGVAGHAGLFSTAADVSIFCQMILNGGSYKGARILSPLTVDKMTTSADGRGGRGLGWDIDTAYSSNRGELLPIGSFGHTGFTGTSIWIDPQTKMYVVFMSNRVHPNGKGDVTPLRAQSRDHRCFSPDGGSRVLADGTLHLDRVDPLRRRRRSRANAGDDRARRLAKSEFRGAGGQARRAWSPTIRDEPATVRPPSICSSKRKASSWSRSSVPSTGSGASSTRACRQRRMKRPSCRSSPFTARLSARQMRCWTGWMQSSSTSRTSALAFTPT